MKKPHKHAKLIHAYADGAEIQLQNSIGEWMDEKYPTWNLSAVYRIKPEFKPDVVTIDCVVLNDGEAFFEMLQDNLKLTWCGSTGKLKSAEVL